MRQSDVGSKFAIEYWGHRYGEMTWIETGYQDLATQPEADKIAKAAFAEDTRVVEYTTTSRVVSEHPAADTT